jgi:flagellar basal-body rod protein FlgB
VKIFDQTFRTLERALDVRMARQGVLAGNLANVNTPGFTPRDLDFAAAMRSSGPAPGERTPAADGPTGRPAAGELPLDLVALSWPTLPGAPTPPGRRASALSDAPAAAAGLDGNAVDADRTLVALSENAIHYGAAAKAIAKKLAILRYVASDGTA